MRTFVIAAVVSFCAFQCGSTNESVDRAHKNVKELAEQAHLLVDFLKIYTEEFILELTKNVDVARIEYQKRFDKDIEAVLAEIKDAVEHKKLHKAHTCYEAAKSRFNKLNDTSNKHLEECSEQETVEINPDDFVDKIIDELSNGKKFIEYAEKLEKEVDAAKDEAELRSVTEDKLPAARATLKIYEVALNSLMNRGNKLNEAVKKQAENCADKEFADVHITALIVRENALQCIEQL